MNTYYKTIVSTVNIEGINYNTYGIVCIIDGNIYDTIYDISLCKCKVDNLCNLLNRLNIPYVHFKDFCEDYTE